MKSLKLLLLTIILPLLFLSNVFAVETTLPSRAEGEYATGDAITADQYNTDMNTIEVILESLVLADINDITSTYSELNIFAGAGISATEIGYLNGSLLGTVVASKLIAVDSNKNITGFGTIGATGIITGGGFTIGSAAINETELEYLDAPTKGTGIANKVIVLDANKDFDFDGGDLTVYDLTVEGSVTGGSTSDNKVKVSSNDTTANYLFDKTAEGEGIDLTETSDGSDEDLTISCEDATSANKGIAKFNTSNFAVSSGEVIVKNDGIAAEEINGLTGSGAVDSDNVPEGSANLYQDDEVTNWIDNVTLGSSGALTIPTGQDFKVGTVQWDSGDDIDGEVIADNTIDEDSIDWGTGTDQVSTDDVIEGSTNKYIGSMISVNVYTAVDVAIDAEQQVITFTENWDTGDDFASDAFVAPTDGKYLFILKMNIKTGGGTNTADGLFTSKFKIGAGSTNEHITCMSTEGINLGTTSYIHTTILNLTATDSVTFFLAEASSDFNIAADRYEITIQQLS